MLFHNLLSQGLGLVQVFQLIAYLSPAQALEAPSWISTAFLSVKMAVDMEPHESQTFESANTTVFVSHGYISLFQILSSCLFSLLHLLSVYQGSQPTAVHHDQQYAIS